MNWFGGNLCWFTSTNTETVNLNKVTNRTVGIINHNHGYRMLYMQTVDQISGHLADNSGYCKVSLQDCTDPEVTRGNEIMAGAPWLPSPHGRTVRQTTCPEGRDNQLTNRLQWSKTVQNLTFVFKSLCLPKTVSGSKQRWNLDSAASSHLPCSQWQASPKGSGHAAWQDQHQVLRFFRRLACLKSETWNWLKEPSLSLDLSSTKGCRKLTVQFHSDARYWKGIVRPCG